jgi:hypothetical protein
MWFRFVSAYRLQGAQTQFIYIHDCAKIFAVSHSLSLFIYTISRSGLVVVAASRGCTSSSNPLLIPCHSRSGFVAGQASFVSAEWVVCRGWCCRSSGWSACRHKLSAVWTTGRQRQRLGATAPAPT